MQVKCTHRGCEACAPWLVHTQQSHDSHLNHGVVMWRVEGEKVRERRGSMWNKKKGSKSIKFKGLMKLNGLVDLAIQFL